MAIAGSHDRITAAVTQWPGVTATPHRFGGTEYRLGSREFGHIHGEYLVDIPFPTKVRDALVDAGEAEPHHVLPNSGWISLYLNYPQDVDRALDLLRRSYDFAVRQRDRRSQSSAAPAAEDDAD